MATKTKRRKDRLTPAQARAARRARRSRRKRLVKGGAIFAIGLIAFLFIVALFAPGLHLQIGGAGSGDAGIRVADQGRAHIAFDEAHPPYNSVPATSGWHYAQPLAPARWGVHDEILADEVLVHNLEHGGIGVHYDCPEGCDELVAQLTAVVDRAVGGGLKVIMSPYAGMEARISLTAWNFIDKLDVFDEERIKNFINSHESSSNAPEGNIR